MIPTPPAPFRCPVDTECFPNYWLFGIRYATGDVWQCRAIGPHASLSADDRETIRRICSSVPICTFNGERYDLWMIAAALAGYTVGQLKAINDKIIAERVKPWTLGIPRWRPADHIDVMEVIPGAGGQKYKAGVIHYRTMMESPVDFNAHLTPEQMREVDTYNANDLGQLLALHDAVRPQIALREKLTARYGIDLRSKSDAQVAEAVLKARCEAALGRPIPKQDADVTQTFRYDPPAYLSFTSPQLNDLLRVVREGTFYIGKRAPKKPPKDGESREPKLKVLGPVELEEYEFDIDGLALTAGLGGMHSSEETVAHHADDDTMLVDIDVASYYPNLMLNAGAWPDALGPQFLIEYGGITNERICAKSDEKVLAERLADLRATSRVTPSREIDSEIRQVELALIEAKAMNNGGKIAANGTFGKTGSVFSVLFAPKMMIQTTLTGQLSLLMLIEWMHAAGVRVISANTDGIVTKFRRELLPVMRAVVKRWEMVTSLEMEETHYRSIYSRDVNNYLAVTAQGKVKRKGIYAPTDLILKKAPDLEICADACAEFVKNGTPVADTILSCGDVRKFVTIQNVAGGAVKWWGEGPRSDLKVADMLPRLAAHGWSKRGVRWVHPDHPEPLKAADAYAATFAPQVPEPLAKVVRWYYSRNAPGPIRYASGKKAGHLVGNSWGARPAMNLPDSLPEDIDYVYYIDIATQMLRDCAAI